MNDHAPKTFDGLTVLVKIKVAQRALAVGTTTIYKLVKQGKLTPIKFGSRCTRFRLSEIEALIDAQTVAGDAK